MRQTILMLFLLYPVALLADSNIARERITCYQHGQQILDLSDRLRGFEESDNFKQLAEINLGQVGRELVRIYSVDSGNLTCIQRTHE